MNKKIDAFNNLIFYRNDQETSTHKNNLSDNKDDTIIEFKKIELSKKNR